MRIFGQHDEQTIIQFEHVREHAVDAALMADGHVGYVMPIGGVAAYRNQVSVVGVGFDIACGNAAIATDLHVDNFAREARSTAANVTSRSSGRTSRSARASADCGGRSRDRP